jgi:hypothetical protein
LGTVLVIGGGGFYGRYVVADLLRHTNAKIVVAGRRPPPLPSSDGRVVTAVCDLNDLAALQRVVAECDVVVHCAGPFQCLPLNPLRAAIGAGVNYVDIAEDREFARRVRALAPECLSAGITALSGISVAPSMEALVTELVRPRFDRLLAVRTFAAPDTRHHRGRAMFHTMLFGVGRPFEQPRHGKQVRVHGWTEPEWVTFPPPVGRRLTYLVLEMADLDDLPRLFGVETVEFKAGCEHPLLNRMLGWAAARRARTGHPHWEKYTSIVRAVSWLAGRFGREEGGVVFEVSGTSGTAIATHRIAVMAETEGGRIPSVLAGMAVLELLQGRLSGRGLVDVHAWLTPERFIDGLACRGLRLWSQAPEEAGWRPLSPLELQKWRGVRVPGVGSVARGASDCAEPDAAPDRGRG